MQLTEMQLTVGMQIKGYRLQQHLGTGASGEVWNATARDQTFAIKFMNAKLLASDDATDHFNRFKYEIRALIELRHMHVPRLYGYPRPYIVMAHIEGQSLSQLINTGEIFGVPLAKRFKLLCIIATTLVTAHHKDIIHRDIKPANIKGIEIPYLLDFGIAWDAKRNTAASTVGTPVYMPPIAEPLDAVGDNYSFALVAYETLFGQHPIFTTQNIGKTVAETRQRAGEYLKHGQWHLPSHLSFNEVPPDLREADLQYLDKVFQRALGEREARYPTLTDFLADLKFGLLAGKTDFDPITEHQSPFPLQITPLDTETNLQDDSPVLLYRHISLVVMLLTAIVMVSLITMSAFK